jgi:tRNA modification GTPase
LEVNLELGGYPVTVADTAGIREAEDEIEIEGVRRSLQRAQNSEIRIAMTDVTAGQRGLVGLEGLIDKNTVLVVNKVDLGVPNGISPVSAAAANIHISVKTGAGIDLLLTTLETLASEKLASGSEAVVTRARHRQAIEDVLTCLERAVESKRIDEFVAEEIRLATRSIGRVMGQVDVEQVLDVLFREFCIGK